jgi:hypothetical protein
VWSDQTLYRSICNIETISLAFVFEVKQNHTYVLLGWRRGYAIGHLLDEELGSPKQRADERRPDGQERERLQHGVAPSTNQTKQACFSCRLLK